MYEVRFHGRGGQGAVMAAQALASAAFQEGGYATAFPFFGAERRGAPVLAFTRIDTKRIYRKTQVYEPDVVVVLDEGLVETVNVVEGEDIVGVNPTAEKLDFGDLSRSNGMTRYVTLQSAGSMPSYIIIWKFGAISSLVTVEKNYFVLEPQKELKIAFTITIPPSAETKHYNGQVILFKLPKIF